MVEGVCVNGILLDTGATQSMVREDLVPPDRRADGETTITCAHGDRVVYPLAAVSVGVGSQHLVVRAGVSHTLPVPVLLGRDVPKLAQLLESESGTAPEPQESGVEDVLTAFSCTDSRPARPRVLRRRSREFKGASPTPQEAEHKGASPTPQSAAAPAPPHRRPQSAATLAPPHRRPQRATPTPQESTAHSSASPTPPQVQDLPEDELQRPHEDEEPLEAARIVAKKESKPGPADGNYSRDSSPPNSVERPPGKRPRCGEGDHWARDCSNCKREGTLLPPRVATATLECVASPRIDSTDNHLGYILPSQDCSLQWRRSCQHSTTVNRRNPGMAALA